MPSHSSILLIDDSPGECELFRLALAQTGTDAVLYSEHDAEAAFRLLENLIAYAPGCSPCEETGVVSTARVEGTPPAISQFNRSCVSRSASTETMPVASPSPPSLILLDWHLRNQNGDTFLRRLRADARLAAIPVVCFTTSDASSDLASAYANGANGYVVKPAMFADLIQCVTDICRYWMNRNRTPVMQETRC